MKQINSPRVLVFDVEITLNKEVLESIQKLGVDERTVLQSMNAAVSHVACISYMWLGEKKVHTMSLKDYASYRKNPSDDSALLIDFSLIYNQADHVVAHYGEKFDRPFLNTRIEKNGLERLAPAKLRDTWRIMRSNFKLPNNRLDTALRFFGSPVQKPPLDWDIWRRVALGDATAFGPMIKRCEADTKSLEWLYREKYRKYDNQAINWQKYSEKRICRFCGSTGLINDRRLPDNKMRARCKDCKGYTDLKGAK